LRLVAGFENLQEVTNSISIYSNYSLEELPDFNQLIHLGRLNIFFNHLIQIEGFNRIVEADDISIVGNKNLHTIDGFRLFQLLQFDLGLMKRKENLEVVYKNQSMW